MLWFKSKKQKEYEKKQKKQEELTQALDEHFNPHDYLMDPKNAKKVNNLELKLGREQEALRQELKDRLLDLNHQFLASKSYNETVGEKLKDVIRLIDKIQFGLSLSTTQTMAVFMRKTISDCLLQVHSDNPAGLMDSLDALDSLLGDMEDSTAKLLYSDPEYLKLQQSEFTLLAERGRLDRQRKKIQDQGRQIMKLHRSDPDFMPASRANESLKELKKQSQLIQRDRANTMARLEPVQAAIETKKNNLSMEKMGLTDQELLVMLNREEFAEERRADNSADFKRVDESLRLNRNASSESDLVMERPETEKKAQPSESDLDATVSSL